MWPRCGPSGPELGRRVRYVIRPDATPMPQVRPNCDGALLSVRDRQMPVLRHAEGTAGEDEAGSELAAMVTS
jgi:hypothetical protein